ncbi:MAG: hypothetical protein QXL78_06180 [Methanocellales archaeon]
MLKVLQYNGALTMQQIIFETTLPSRTARYAIALLDRNNFLEKHFNFKDARQILYRIKT